MPAENIYGKLTAVIVEAFKDIIGSQYVLMDEESFEKYGKDETENLFFPPEVVLKPRTTEEISKILKIYSKSINFKHENQFNSISFHHWHINCIK